MFKTVVNGQVFLRVSRFKNGTTEVLYHLGNLSSNQICVQIWSDKFVY